MLDYKRAMGAGRRPKPGLAASRLLATAAEHFIRRAMSALGSATAFIMPAQVRMEFARAL